MEKIKTIFKRDMKTKKVIDEFDVKLDNLPYVICTEKIDGTNIRLTIRSGEVVRIEARKNPSKQQKQNGIIQPWYRDIDKQNDKWILDAVNNTDFSHIEDGEWNAEAYGKKIQGNPLNVDNNKVYVFSNWNELMKIEFNNVPFWDYEELKEWLKDRKSLVGNGNIEGLVFYDTYGFVLGKIKTKDFDYGSGN